MKYLSRVFFGKKYGFSLLKSKLSPYEAWFKQFNIKVGLGYVYIAKHYQSDSLSIPHKKSKNHPLTEGQKEASRKLACERIVIENSFAGFKCYRMLLGRLRIHDLDFYNEILGVCAGI